MIPEFPQFKSLELSDKKDVEKFTVQFLPYSDFNFSNIWIWDLKKEMKLSILNNNLVVRFTDYLSGKPFLSFLGKNMVNETAKDLIIFSENKYKTDTLKFIPETVIKFLDKTKFEIIPDVDSHDYIYNLSKVSFIILIYLNKILKYYLLYLYTKFYIISHL